MTTKSSFDASKSTSFRRKNADVAQKKVSCKKKTGFCYTHKKVSCKKKTGFCCPQEVSCPKKLLTFSETAAIQFFNTCNRW